jgi:hypothetical protein
VLPGSIAPKAIPVVISEGAAAIARSRRGGFATLVRFQRSSTRGPDGRPHLESGFHAIQLINIVHVKSELLRCGSTS